MGERAARARKGGICVKILLTGGSGFLGSHIVEPLLDLGQEVVVFDRICPGKIEHRLEEIEFVHGDVKCFEDCVRAVRDVNAVIHLAALINVDHSIKDPLEFYEVNTRGTMNLLEAARHEPVLDRFVYMSTAEVYGTSDAPLKETDLCDARSPYAASKFAAERYCLSYYYTYGLPETTIIRGFNIYGPRQAYGPKGAVIAIFTNLALMEKSLMIYGDGTQSRDYIYVEDVASGVIKAMLTRGLGGEIINLASGKTVSINQIAELVLRRVGSTGLIEHTEARPGEVHKNCGDPSKAERILGWKPIVDFDEGIGRTVEYFRNKG